MIKTQERESEFVVGLDVGTSTVRAVVAVRFQDSISNVKTSEEWCQSLMM